MSLRCALGGTCGTAPCSPAAHLPPNCPHLAAAPRSPPRIAFKPPRSEQERLLKRQEEKLAKREERRKAVVQRVQDEKEMQ